MNTIQIINCSGFAQTGCTAQVDILRDFRGVEGLVSPYNELGVLKMPNSFGGILFALQTKTPPATRAALRQFLISEPAGTIEAIGDELHRQRRARLISQVGPAYPALVDEALEDLPDSFEGLDLSEAIPLLRAAFQKWLKGCINQLPPAHFNTCYSAHEPLIVGMKNDPPGSMPLLSALYEPGARMSAVIRDPRDTNYDFNRYYQLGFSPLAVEQQAKIYLGQINATMNAVKSYRRYFEDSYSLVEFERLVTDTQYRQAYVDFMVGPRPKIFGNFDAEESAKNIGLYHKFDPDLLGCVERLTMTAYEDFLRFMEAEGLMFSVAKTATLR